MKITASYNTFDFTQSVTIRAEIPSIEAKDKNEAITAMLSEIAKTAKVEKLKALKYNSVEEI